jgi:hypothetical protein
MSFHRSVICRTWLLTGYKEPLAKGYIAVRGPVPSAFSGDRITNI